MSVFKWLMIALYAAVVGWMAHDGMGPALIILFIIVFGWAGWVFYDSVLAVVYGDPHGREGSSKREYQREMRKEREESKKTLDTLGSMYDAGYFREEIKAYREDRANGIIAPRAAPNSGLPKDAPNLCRFCGRPIHADLDPTAPGGLAPRRDG